jgi:glutaredoxin 2
MQQTPNQIKKIEEELTKVGSNVTKQAKGFRDSTFTRFPIIFSLLTTFGLVATLYGFEKVIDKMDWLSNHPEILLVIGLATLAGTGTLYKKLS